MSAAPASTAIRNARGAAGGAGPSGPASGRRTDRDSARVLTPRLQTLRIAVVGLLLLGGCATSRVPESIRDPALPSPAVSEVQQRPETFIGQRARWGGSILGVHNARDTTGIEVLARPLNSSGEPDGTAGGLGRFIVELPGFKDPAEYPQQRRLTVVGPLVRVETRDVGEYPYPYPVVAGDVWYLWPDPPTVTTPWPYDYPWYRPWYGPYFGPWLGPWYGPWY
ncbi:Slp family lipoprotein [Thiocapsa bogorovii]|uniref:Slp family lipoprotein n=1 Tax=Thiocapsa bogorovii TaxID=521689 RepID=UPI001E48F548|nr:Slp family lipoprotein [Thiocapsa bogorovii]UHD15160.1 Slp family lipoprotein [Thiocapsa bogorovii]